MDAGEVVTPNSAPTPGSISSGSRQSGLNESGSMDLTEIPDGGLQRRQSIYSTVVASKVSISFISESNSLSCQRGFICQQHRPKDVLTFFADVCTNK